METHYRINPITSIKISSKYLGSVIGFPNSKDDKSNHNKFEITLIRTQREDPDLKVSFDFYGSSADHDKGITDLNRTDLIESLRCFIDDSLMGLHSFDEFCDELGYDNDSMSAFRVYQECQKQLKKAKKLGFNENQMYNILNKLSDEGY